jgi:hypothetical protein
MVVPDPSQGACDEECVEEYGNIGEDGAYSPGR